MRAPISLIALWLLTGIALAQNWTISAPGSYTLSADSISTGIHNIRITADNVDLDLGGHLVRCNAPNPTTATTFGVSASNRTNITIRNGRITGCQFGVHASYSSNVLITGIDFTGNRYVGASLGGADNRIVGNVFAEIGGWATDAYAIGVNSPGPRAIVSRNVFTNLYRQELATPDMVGEGVGVIVSPDTPDVSIRDNVFVNDEPRQEKNIGVWIGVNASTLIRRNMFFNYDWAIGAAQAGVAQAEVSHNLFWLQEGPGHWAIDVTEGSASNNLVVGWDDPWNGNVVDAGGNVVLP